MDDATPIECGECEATVRLFRVPAGDLQLVCDCEGRGIEVTDAVGESALFDPFSGHWTDIDRGR